MAAAPPPVLLGLRDSTVPPGDGLPPQGTASKLGGSPDWRLSVAVVHPSCGICRAGLLHVVQIYCPLEGSLYHRVINVFACAKKLLGNSESWKVLRSQYLQIPRKEIQDYTWKQEQERTRAVMDWCDGADDWGEDCKEASSELYTTDDSGEKYEKSEAKKRNQMFHKFMKRISFCQEQILRYSWDGQPLFITSPSADFQATVPPCNNCKSNRIFEFQLMPAMVNMLKIKDNDTSIEFGTAVVYTCEKSCWTASSAPLEEYIFVQEDPDQQLFK